MTDQDDAAPQGTGHQEPHEVRVAAAHGHGEHQAAAGHDTTDGAHAGHGTDDAHGEHGEALGPVDVRAWSVGVLGVAIGIAVAVCFAIATGYVG